MLDIQQLGQLIDERFHRPGDQIFRMETLPEYSVGSDGGDFRRWLEGAKEPTWSRKEPWLNTLRARRANGQISRRVRVLSARLTDYERYACEFGYAYNCEAGEDIRVLHRGEHTLPESLINRDFWLINENTVVWMFYDEYGRFDGAEEAGPAELASHLQAYQDAWEVAEPFPQWWARHPELHRQLAA